MAKEFVNHHVHSHFSALDGLSKPRDIVDRVIEMGQRSVSITDHGSMSGIPEMYRIAKDSGIGFTPGIEAYFAKDRFYHKEDRLGEKYYHLILLAYSNQGYQNLMKLQTPSWEEGFYHKPRLDYDLLEQYNEGLTVTTACLGGIVNQHLLRGDYNSAKEELSKFVDIFGKEHVYVEIQKGSREKELILGDQVRLAQEFGLGLLPTADSHYTHQSDHDYHDTLLCCSTIATKDQPNRFKFDSDQYHLHSNEEMEKLFPEHEFPGALDNTVELAEKTDFTMKIGKDKEYIMPTVVTKKGMTEAETLRAHVLAGARDPKRYGDEDGNIPDEVMERIDYELGVVDNMGFNGYFLIVENMIKLFAEHEIYVGTGRGCLHPETKVLTQRGYLPITEVTNEDKVVTSDGEWCRVLENLQHETVEDEQLVKITTIDNKTIMLTEKHKALTYVNDHHSWRKASGIVVGDELIAVTEQGEIVRVVKKVERVNAPQFVYDLTIEGDPSFLTDCSTVHNSAPGSVVVYCLGITNLDPMRHDLFFERFLNPDRISMPDIDIDIPKTKRGQALKLLEEEYGEGHVAHISNYGTMQDNAAMRRVSKVFGLSPSETDAFTKKFFEYCEQTGTTVEELAKSPVIPEELLDIFILDKDTLREIISATHKLTGVLESYGVHACGIVITSTPVDNHFPIRLSKKGILPVCQYDGEDIEDLGGVKMDVLGLISLDVAEGTEENIRYDLNEEVDSYDLPLDDRETYETFASGETGGVFQMGCLAGDTIVDGTPIQDMYNRRNSSTNTTSLRSVFLGEGYVHYNRCIDVVYSGKKDIYATTLTNGEVLRATKDHKVFTQKGWKPIGELSPGDAVFYIEDSNTGSVLPGTVRGRDDIYDIFETTNPEFEIISLPEPVTIGQKTFYPTFVKKSDKKHFAYIYPDRAHKQALEVQKETEYDNNEYTIDLYPYSKVVEEAYQKTNASSFLMPYGTQWVEVVSVKFDTHDDTYDIMMLAPVNNFIANGIMVHNSSGMKTLLRNMRPDSFEDISAANALYRPGPMGMDSHTEYAHRKNGLKDIEYFHEDAQDVLGETYGICVTGDTLIYDAETGVPHRIDSIEDMVNSGMSTFGVLKDGTVITSPIEAWWCTGEKEIYRLETTEGVLEGSKDHPVLTGNGWKRIEDIACSDRVALTNSDELTLSVKNDEEGNVRWSQVTSCGSTGRVEKVYDISVPKTKNFIANGNIVVSNCVFQEQIMSMAQKFAHYTGAEADELRKAVGKKIPEKMEEQHQKLIPAVDEYYPDEPELGQEIWDIIEPFGSYAFNKCLHGRTNVVSESGGSVRIEDLYRSGDYRGRKILSMYPDGEIKYHKIKDVIQSGRKPVYTVKTQKGRTIMITEDHRMLTVDGYGTIKDGSIYVGQELISDDYPDGRRKYYVSDDDRNRRSLGAINAGKSEKSRERAREWMTYYQSTLTFDDRSQHQKKVQKDNPDRLKNGQEAAQRRLAWLRENDPQWVMDWGVKNAAALERSIQNAQKLNGRSGFGIRTPLSDGRIADSIVESLAGEYLISRGVDFEMHKTFVSTQGTVRITDFYADGIYFEMDGLSRGKQWFIDNKYGDEIPFVYMTPGDYKDKIDEALMRHNITNGDKVIEIIPPKLSKKGLPYTEMTYDIEMEDDGPSNFIANGLVSHNSHSAAYGMLAYRTAWLKTHYPAQFAGSSIDCNMDNKDRKLSTIAWVKEMGVQINHPDVNVSEMRTVTGDMEVTLPFHVISGLGEAKSTDFIEERENNGKYDSVVDFVARNKVPKNMVIMMAKAGCFDSLNAERATIISKIDDIMSKSASNKGMNTIKDGLFGNLVEDIMDDNTIDLTEPVERVIDDEKVVDVTIEQLARWEREAVGFIMGEHPFEEFRNMKSSQKFLKKYKPIDQLTGEDDNVFATAMLTNLVTKMSRKQNLFQVFDLETDRAVITGLYFGDRKLLPSMEDTLVALRNVKVVVDDYQKERSEGGGEGSDEIGEKVSLKVIISDKRREKIPAEEQIKTLAINKFREKERLLLEKRDSD